MKIIKTNLEGVFKFEAIPVSDDRGSLSRLYCKKILDKEGIQFNVKQISSVLNPKKFTLRGLHFQKEPKKENKIIFCLQGKIWDVVVDLRKNSKSFKQWAAFELGENCSKGLLIPKGYAHGYLTISNNVSLLYYMDEFYDANFSAGIAWNDKDIGINWPHKPMFISKRDSNLPSLSDL